MPLYNFGSQGQASSNAVIYRVSDSDYSIPANADLVLNLSQTATRTFTLPAGANLFNGKRITIVDAAGSAWFGMPLVIQRSATDPINANQSKAYIEFPYDALTFIWDNATGWTYAEAHPPRSDAWYLQDVFGYPINTTPPALQPTWNGTGTTFTNYSYTAQGGMCLNVSMSTASTSWGGTAAWAGATPLQLGSGGGTYFLEILASLDTLLGSTDGRFAVGFMVGSSVGANAEPANGAYIMHNPASNANWVGRTAASSVRSSVLDSNMAVATANFHRFAVKLTPASASFAINRTMFGAITTNIPSGTGQRLSFGTYSTRNNVNNGSQAFNYNLYGFRFLYLPPSFR